MFTRSTTTYNIIAMEIMCGIITKVGLQRNIRVRVYAIQIIYCQVRQGQRIQAWKIIIIIITTRHDINKYFAGF